MNKQISDKKITKREDDFSQWYLDIVFKAELADYGAVKGTMVIRPYGYAIWEIEQQILDKKFKETGVVNAYFPLFIPERLLNKEKNHIDGFSPEVAVVTHAGGNKLDEKIVVRPTSETIIYESFSKWIHSYRDLPLLINQWANVVRWELKTKPFIRTTEFLWQEGHTVHETNEGAEERTLQMLNVYKDFSENYMAIPTIIGKKTEAEKFAGALKTYSVEAMMQDGKALQYATSHNLGQNFSKAFDVKYLDEENKEQYGWQTSWGISTRSIGALIMVHSDDKGLVLPPKMAPIQIIITTIFAKEKDKEIFEIADLIYKELEEGNIKVKTDKRDLTPGEKFFEWEKKGIPIRIEIGAEEIKNKEVVFVNRIDGSKTKVSLNQVLIKAKEMLDQIQNSLYQNALKNQKENVKNVKNWDELVAEVSKGNFVLAYFCCKKEIEKKIKEETGITTRCIKLEDKKTDGVCIKTGEKTQHKVYFAKAY